MEQWWLEYYARCPTLQNGRHCMLLTAARKLSCLSPPSLASSPVTSPAAAAAAADVLIGRLDPVTWRAPVPSAGSLRLFTLPQSISRVFGSCWKPATDYQFHNNRIPISQSISVPAAVRKQAPQPKTETLVLSHGSLNNNSILGVHR